MKNLIIAVTLVILAACGGKTSDHSGHNMEAMDSGNPNQALYDQVMDIHDEVMPKAEELYNLRKQFQEKITSTPAMAEEEKKKLEDMIASLDSANNAMMTWMHEFNPLPDSVDQEKARAYLENEMESIKKVRDLTNETLEKAKAIK